MAISLLLLSSVLETISPTSMVPTLASITKAVAPLIAPFTAAVTVGASIQISLQQPPSPHANAC